MVNVTHDRDDRRATHQILGVVFHLIDDLLDIRIGHAHNLVTELLDNQLRGIGINRQVCRHAVDLIALTRKAGRAVCGFEKVKGWLAGGENVRVLLQASDGSERGKAKLWTPEGARYFGCFTSEELGLAFGRGSAIHGALSNGKLANRVVEEATKLRGLREIDGDDVSAGKDKEAK